MKVKREEFREREGGRDWALHPPSAQLTTAFDLILPSENRLRFLEAEGVELMCLMLRSKNMCRFGAMRVRFGL